MRTRQDDEVPDFNWFSQSADVEAYVAHIWEARFEGERGRGGDAERRAPEVARTQEVGAAVEAVKRGAASAVTLLQEPGPLDPKAELASRDCSKSSDWRAGPYLSVRRAEVILHGAPENVAWPAAACARRGDEGKISFWPPSLRSVVGLMPFLDGHLHRSNGRHHAPARRFAENG